MLERFSARTKRNAALLLLAALVAWFGWEIRAVLNPVLAGYLLAFVLHPLVERLERRGLSRRSAVNLTFAGGLLLAVVIVVGTALQVRALALETVRTARDRPAAELGAAPPPSLQERLQVRLDEFTESAAELGIPLPRWEVPELGELRELAAALLEEHGEELQAAAGKGLTFLLRLLGAVVAFLGLFVLVPIYTYYFLFELERIHGFVRRYLPARERDRIAGVSERIGEVVASFFRGRLGICLLKGALLSAGLALADVDYALLFGMLSGLLSIVPFFGPFLGFVLAFVVGILEHGVLSSLVRTGLVFGAAELLEGYVLVPKILGDQLGLHPLVVIVALLAGGAAAGMLGVLLALPVTAALVILAREYVLPALRAWADEETRAAPVSSSRSPPAR